MLNAENITFAIGGPISFSLQNGEALVIMGPSGAGKSLLLRAIADIDPNTGNISTSALDRDVCSPSVWRKAVAMLPAESGWWSDKVNEHFTSPEKAKTYLPDLGLPEQAMEWSVSRLSSGERHRLALARILETQPEVMLLDEPTATLDNETTQLVENVLLKLLENGLTLVIVSHDPLQASRLNAKQKYLVNGQLEDSL